MFYLENKFNILYYNIHHLFIMDPSKFLISPSELIDLLKDKNNLKHIRIIDGTSYPPLDPRSRTDSFKQSRIPYSQLFDIDLIATVPHPIPHMMPNNETFITHMKRLDLRKSDRIIIYDRVSMFASPRVWFTLYYFGHRNIQILNGGFPAYEKLSGPLEMGDTAYGYETLITERQSLPLKEDDYQYELEKGKVLDLKAIVKNECNDEIIDARHEDRYNGKVDEPRKSLRVGHVEGAKCVFFKHLFNEQGEYLDKDKLEEVFKSKGVDLNKNVIAYCGTGLTACIDLFAIALIGKADKCKLYDASWAEYGNTSLEDIEKIKKE